MAVSFWNTTYFIFGFWCASSSVSLLKIFLNFSLLIIERLASLCMYGLCSCDWNASDFLYFDFDSSDVFPSSEKLLGKYPCVLLRDFTVRVVSGRWIIVSMLFSLIWGTRSIKTLNFVNYINTSSWGFILCKHSLMR